MAHPYIRYMCDPPELTSSVVVGDRPVHTLLVGIVDHYLLL